MDKFLTALVLQPDSRIRKAFIAEILLHPEYAQSIPIALRRLHSQDQYIMKLLYTAAVFLQQKHRAELAVFMCDDWQELPDLYYSEFVIAPSESPDENLVHIGIEYQLRTGEIVDWIDTCDRMVWFLLQRLELFAKDAE